MSDQKKPERPDLNYDHPLLDFPDGNGDKDCPHCKGRGVISVEIDIGGGVKWPGGTQNCKCLFKKDLLANIKRIWPVLLTVESVSDSPLMAMTKQNLWITASAYDFRRHLRFVAFRMGTKWDARVVADATLVTAWLATTAKYNVRDADVIFEREEQERGRPSQEFLTLADLVVPFDLLIIRLGVKAAANKEMANVLAEALNEREQQGKPTWVVDSPSWPLAPGHLCYNGVVMDILDGFRRVVLSKTEVARGAAGQYKAHAQKAPAAPSGSTSPYLRRKGGMLKEGDQAPVCVEVEDTPFRSMALEDDGERPESWDYGQKPTFHDDDEFSVASLMADAHDPGPGTGGRLDEDEFDPDEAIENFPSADELGGNAGQLPAFLKGPLTKEERLAQEKQNRYARRGTRGQKGDDE